MTAWAILMRNKVRSILTMLGIVIGVASMIIILAVGAGAQGLILSQVKSLGSNLIAVLPGKSESNGPPAAAFGIVITTLTADDGKALVSGGFPGLTAQTPYVRGGETVTWEDAKTDTTYVGVLASYTDVESAEVAKGRYAIGFQQVSELLPVPGVTFVGELPDNLQYITRFAGAVTVSADHPQEGKALLTYLASPAAQETIHATGMRSVAAAAPVSQKDTVQ